MKSSLPKAIVVHADGTIEQLGDNPGVMVLYRDEKCDCGNVKRRRRFECHEAHNDRTLGPAEVWTEKNYPTHNVGVMVYVEVPYTGKRD